MVPIYLPHADRPLDAVLAVEARLLSRDGAYHVGELYFAKQSDAEIVRRLKAEKIVREQERLGRICSWCLEDIRNGQFTRVVALEKVHEHCAAEFGAWTAPPPTVATAVACRMVNKYPRVDDCGKPTVRGFRRASRYPDKRPGETYPCCPDCQQRLGIAEDRMRAL